MKRLVSCLLCVPALASSTAAQADYDDFAREVLTAMADEGELQALVQTHVVHAPKFVHELLWQALRSPASDPRSRNAAKRVAAHSQSAELIEAVARHDVLAGDRLAWAREFHAPYMRAVDAAQQGEWELVAENCLLAVDLAQAAEIPYLELRARRFAAEAHQQAGAGPAFRSEMQAVLRLESLLQLVPDEAIDRAALARFEFENAHWEAARTQFLAAIEAAHVAGQSQQAQRFSLELARMENALGRYGAAIATLQKALARDPQEPEKPSARLWIDLASLYSELGRTSDAEDALTRALALLPEGHELAHTARLTQGLVALDAGRTEEAVLLFAAVVTALDESSLRAHARRLHGMALLEAGDPRTARDELRAALRFQPNTVFEQALCWSLLGEAHLAASELEAADTAFVKAAELAASLDSRELAWRANAGQGRLSERLGREAQALESYRRAIDDIEALRSLLVAPELLLRFLDRKRDLYTRTAKLCARTGDLQGAFRMAATAKARTLVETLRGAPGEEPPLTPKAREWAARLAEAEARLRVIELRLGQGEDFMRESLLRERRDMRAERERIKLDLELSDPRGAALLGWGEPLELERLQEKLSEGEALLEYIVGESGVAALLLREQHSAYFELQITEAQIEALSARLREPLLALRAGRTDSTNLRFDVTAARELHRQLIAPLAKELADTHTLWIVPDGALRSLSFAALVTNWERRPVDPARLYAQYEGCRFLVEDLAIGYLPSSSLLAERPVIEGTALLISDPTPLPDRSRALQAARQETARIATSLPPAGLTTLSGQQATEQAVKQHLTSTTRTATLHFATHGVLDDRRPKYSRLALAPGPGEDGWLHAYEIEALHLTGRVTLSACETLSPSGRAEGLLGLTRAFLIAGADSVLATLWSIDDAHTASLMAGYYQGLAEGKNAPAALRTAQLAALSRRQRPGVSGVHPFFWAAFVHVGAP